MTIQYDLFKHKPKLPGKSNLIKYLKVKMLNREQKYIRLFEVVFFHCIMKTKRTLESEDCGIWSTIMYVRKWYNPINTNIYGGLPGCQALRMHVFI